MNPAELFSREPNPVRLEPGDVLFQTGDVADSMYVLLEGTVDISVNGQLAEQSGRGDIIGELALIDHSPRSATAIARDICTLARLNPTRFQTLVQQNPFFALHVMKVLADRIRRTDLMRVPKLKV